MRVCVSLCVSLCVCVSVCVCVSLCVCGRGDHCLYRSGLIIFSTVRIKHPQRFNMNRRTFTKLISTLLDVAINSLFYWILITSSVSVGQICITDDMALFGTDTGC